MSRRIVKFAMAGMLMAVGAAGAIIVREARSAEENFANIATTEGKRPYRHMSHFTTSIVLPSNSTYSFSNTTIINPAQFSNGAGGTASWEVYTSKVCNGGKKLVIVFVAKNPVAQAGAPAAAVSGTGTITITTTEPGCCPTTTSGTVPVEPIDGSACP